jgi:hypothetical protein
MEEKFTIRFKMASGDQVKMSAENQWRLILEKAYIFAFCL